jgi:transcriptional regulator with XRE-family HTH domain
MPKPKPKPQARGLAAGLRAARKETKQTIMEVIAQLGWSQSMLSRIETGKRNASPEEVSALVTLYRITGERRDQLLGLARDIDRPNWLETRYSEVPEQAKTLAQYESEATRLVYVSTILVPGLLQITSYARALMSAVGVPASDIEARVKLRLDRQRVLMGKTSPRLVAVMDEAVFRRRIGGRRVMTDQLRHLLAMADRPNVELRVIPFDHGGHAAVAGPYFLLEFANARPVVHLEHAYSGIFLHEQKDVDPYVESTASLNAVALDHEQSLRMVAEVLADYDGE